MSSVVIVNDLNLRRSELRPHEAHPVLIVDPNAMMPSAITLQRLQPVGRGNPKVSQGSGGIEQFQLPAGDHPQIRWADPSRPLGVPGIENVLRARIAKGADPCTTIARLSCYCKVWELKRYNGYAVLLCG
jgi:hypothetical protein